MKQMKDASNRVRRPATTKNKPKPPTEPIEKRHLWVPCCSRLASVTYRSPGRSKKRKSTESERPRVRADRSVAVNGAVGETETQGSGGSESKKQLTRQKRKSKMKGTSSSYNPGKKPRRKFAAGCEGGGKERAAPERVTGGWGESCATGTSTANRRLELQNGRSSSSSISLSVSTLHTSVHHSLPLIGLRRSDARIDAA